MQEYYCIIAFIHFLQYSAVIIFYIKFCIHFHIILSYIVSYILYTNVPQNLTNQSKLIQLKITDKIIHLIKVRTQE